MTLQTHDLMPMFAVTNSLDGAPFDYQRVWQRKNLLLVSVASSDTTGPSYVERLLARAGDFDPDDVEVLVTGDIVPGVPSPGVVVADRWGEIYLIQGADRACALPAAEDVVEWVRFVQVQCPECQGETR